MNRRGDAGTRPPEDRGRDWSGTALSQSRKGTQRITWSPQKLQEARGSALFPLLPPPSASRTGRPTFLLFVSHPQWLAGLGV